MQGGDQLGTQAVSKLHAQRTYKFNRLTNCGWVSTTTHNTGSTSHLLQLILYNSNSYVLQLISIFKHEGDLVWFVWNINVHQLRIKRVQNVFATGKWYGGSTPRWSTCAWHCLRTHYTQMDWAFLSSCVQAHRPLPFLLGLLSLSSCSHLGWLILQRSTHTVLWSHLGLL